MRRIFIRLLSLLLLFYIFVWIVNGSKPDASACAEFAVTICKILCDFLKPFVNCFASFVSNFIDFVFQSLS